MQFAGAFAFSPKAWLGVILVGVSAVLFLVSGGIPLVGSRKQRKEQEGAGAARRAAAGQPPATVPATRKQPAAPAEPDDDLSDVRDILKKHGIS